MRIVLLILFPLLSAALQWILCVWADKRPALRAARYFLILGAALFLLGYLAYLTYQYMSRGVLLPIDAVLIGISMMVILVSFCVLILYRAYHYVDRIFRQ